MTNQITVILISVLFGGLLSFFIATLTQRKVFKSIAKELTNYHERIYHKISVHDQINEHQEKCLAVKDIGKLKTGLVWLVSQAGGNPSDIGLN